MWAFADCYNKEQLQNFVFTEGIYYDTENSEYRTKTVNPVFAFISGSQEIVNKKMADFSSLITKNPPQ
jgi:hypothetical protein